MIEELNKEKLKCDDCGKEFVPGNRGNGIPNGIGFVLNDGSLYTVCADCIMRVGMFSVMNDAMRGDD